MGGIVPLILAIYLYLQDAISYLYIVMRAIRATMLGAFFVGRLGVGLGVDRGLFGVCCWCGLWGCCGCWGCWVAWGSFVTIW